MSSSTKTAVRTTKAPPPIEGVLNQAIVSGGFVFCSGQVARNPATGAMVEGGVQARTVRDATGCVCGREERGEKGEQASWMSFFLSFFSSFFSFGRILLHL